MGNLPNFPTNSSKQNVCRALFTVSSWLPTIFTIFFPLWNIFSWFQAMVLIIFTTKMKIQLPPSLIRRRIVRSRLRRIVRSRHRRISWVVLRKQYFTSMFYTCYTNDFMESLNGFEGIIFFVFYYDANAIRAVWGANMKNIIQFAWQWYIHLFRGPRRMQVIWWNFFSRW